MDEMHGVLMHGDKELGTDHTKNDEEKAAKDSEKFPPSNVKDAHQFMHQNDDTGHIHDDSPRMDVGPRGTKLDLHWTNCLI